MLRKALLSWSYFLIFNVTATTALPFSDTYPKISNIDILHYSFSLNLSDTADVIRAKATITFFLKKDDINKLRLDLIKKDDSLGGKGMSVMRVESNGKALDYSHESNILCISLPSSNGIFRVLNSKLFFSYFRELNL